MFLSLKCKFTNRFEAMKNKISMGKHKFVELTDCFNIPKRYQKRLEAMPKFIAHFFFQSRT